MLRPRVSVILVTYNHESFVAEALHSVLNQSAPFGVEILVSEDCSTDRTRAVLRDFAAREPRIQLLLSERNLNSNEVTSRAVRRARGEYIALLDGDDFWTAPHKLARLVGYLDQHPECALAFHDACVRYSDGNTPEHNYVPDEYRRITSLDDLVQRNYLPGCAPVIRKSALDPLPGWYDDAMFGDWPLYLLAARTGLIGYVDEVMAVYRRHAGGFWSSRSRREQYEAMARFLAWLQWNLGAEYEVRVAAARRLYEVSATVAPRPLEVGSAAAPEQTATPRKRWSQADDDLPWFDRIDAVERLDERVARERLSEQDDDLMRHWLAFGFCVLKGAVDHDDIEQMQREVDALWMAVDAVPELTFVGLRLHAGSEESNVPHQQLVTLDLATRRRIRDRSNYRIHGLHRFSPAAERIYHNANLKRAASLILGMPARPSYCINLTRGSDHELQQDTAVFHITPANFLVGAWLACEDVSPTAGPLVVYPGSHRSPMFAGFDNYPQTNLRTLREPQRYAAFVREQSQDYEPMLFLAAKGDVLLWHGMLIRGDSAATDRAVTRKSYICHYIPPRMDVAAEIVGPFNW